MSNVLQKYKKKSQKRKQTRRVKNPRKNKSKQQVKKKQTIKKKRSYKKKIHNRTKKGGKYLGRGAFGVVYGHPKLPCIGDDLANEDMFRNNVSKTFENEDDFHNEVDSISKLLEEFTHEEITELDKYCVIPLNTCEADCELMTLPDFIYQSRQYQLDSRICTNPSRNKYIINYPLGGKDLDKIFLDREQNGTFELFYENIKRLLNVCKGIRFLQEHNIIHGDIKTPNILKMGDTFKLIDMSDARNMLTTNKTYAMGSAFMYYIWPSIIAWSYVYDPKYRSSELPYEISQSNIKNNYRHHKQYNNQQISTQLPDSFYNWFNEYKTNLSLEEPALDYIDKVISTLYAQKMFIPYARDQDASVLKIKIKKYSDSIGGSNGLYRQLKNKSNPNINKFFKEMNDIRKLNYDISPEQAKLDLFKRVDIYSFGIVLLQCINNFLILHRENLNIEQSNFLINLMNIVFLCCYQDNTAPNINDITKQLESLVTISDRDATSSGSPLSVNECPRDRVRSSAHVTPDPE